MTAVQYRVTQRRVLRSEWSKLWSLRSTWITVALGSVVLLAIGLIASSTFTPGQTQAGPGPAIPTDAVGLALSGTNLALLVIGVLGVMFAAGEYTTGLIKATLSAVPGRLPVLAAKALVVGAVSLAAATVGAFLAFLLGGSVVPDSIALTLGDHGVVRSLLGAGLYLGLVGVLGVGLGVLLRSVAGGVAVLVGAFLLLPGLTGLLPDSWNDAIGPYLPSNAGDSMMSLTTGDGSLSPGAGLTAMVVWVVFVVGAAAYRLRRSDA
jgi:hypothetical protein